MINYKASGNLVAFAPYSALGAPDEFVHLILVEQRSGSGRCAGYVVSLYTLGSAEWINGHYFYSDQREEAMGYFTWRLMEEMTVRGLTAHHDALNMSEKAVKLLRAYKENANAST
jgi:hypothetical protein